MANWDVTLSVTITVTASSVNDAEDAAWEYWETVCPEPFLTDVVLSDDQTVYDDQDGWYTSPIIGDGS